MKNIILIGMSGAGKSTLGVLLAKAINKNFIDTDLLIQQKQNKVLSKIIEAEGIKGFKYIEEQMLLDLNVDNGVIATGGSVVYSKHGMRLLKESGLVVYLHVTYSSIVQRLLDISSRGIVIEKGQTIRDLYDEREPLYAQYADITIYIEEEPIESTLNKIIAELGKKE